MTNLPSEMVWQVMQGRTRDLFLATALLPCIIAFFYGCYQFYTLGASTDYFIHNYIPLVGSTVSTACIIAFSITGTRLTLLPPRVFALYLLCALGAVGVASSTLPTFSFWGILQGAVWTFLGSKMFRRLGKADGLSRTPIDLPGLGGHLVAHVGLHRRDLFKIANDENIAGRLERSL